VVGFDKASNPAKEFGALSFFIGLRLSRLGGKKIGNVAFGPDERTDGLGPALGVSSVAAGQDAVRLVQQRPQPLARVHFRLARLEPKISTVPES
jgi:hypothetical protein